MTRAPAIRTGPPIPLKVKPRTPACRCGAPIIKGKCSKGCRRVVRMDHAR